ncbi:MAG: aminoglycoside phosphotransferase family protein [Candidatus Tectomicrobia bacterium]|nr:aminoglycoside phosphotransferase family protein [Candidatus Tectomicrobia bacterium]
MSVGLEKTRSPSGSSESSVTNHPAFLAWSAVHKQSRLPERICSLYPESLAKNQKHKKKSLSAAYRMEGAIEHGKNIIAKRASFGSIATERIIYEEILPFLPLDALKSYASSRNGETGWLFLEDSAGREWLTDVYWQNELVAEWLAVMHAQARQYGDVLNRLPDKGPDYYLDQILVVKKWAQSFSEYVPLSTQLGSYLSLLIENLNTIGSRWSRIEAICRGAPRTLVHNDIQRKNVHVSGESRITGRLSIFDWETAGHGVPCIDIYCLNHATGNGDAFLRNYQRALSTNGGQSSVDEIKLMATVGGVFRLLDVFTWLGEKYYPQQGSYSWQSEKLLHYLRWFEAATSAFERIG